MLFLSRPRLARRRVRRYRRPLLYALAVFFLVDAWLLLDGRLHTRRTDPQMVVVTEPTGETWSYPLSGNTSVFVVSVHRNTEGILRAAWIQAIAELADHLGADNLYVSAVESGSQDYTKEALLRLRTELDLRGVGHTITLGPTVWGQLDELKAWPAADAPAANRSGWIWDHEEGHYAMRRIPYLARVRNQAMEPLQRLAAAGRRFDRVLWINDVAFDTADVLTLLNTHDGRFAAACAVDFKTYPQYYDTFALRDENGDKAVSAYWPWFRSAASQAAVRAGEPVRVQSCWNGMIAFDARSFYEGMGQAAAAPDAPDAPDAPAAPALVFRGVDDSLAELHLEGSECCLIHADNPLSEADATDAQYGVWLNPNVRVAYTVPVYRQVQRAVFPGALATVAGGWAFRWDRARSGVQFMLETQTVLRRLRQWQAETPAGEPARTEPGGVCLINEMQIMWENGWKHL